MNVKKIVDDFWWHSTNKSHPTMLHMEIELIKILIEAKLIFEVDEYEQLLRNDTYQYASGVHYDLACRVGNTSAAQSIERYLHRKPFILNGKRLYKGAEIYQRNKYLKVNSWSKDGNTINLTDLTGIHYKFNIKDWKEQRKQLNWK